MALHPIEYVKKHPYQTGAIAVVALVAVYYVSTSSSGTVQGAVTGQPTDAQLAAAAHSLDVNAQLQAHTADINGQLALLTQKGANDLALAQIAAKQQGDTIAAQEMVATTHDTLAYELGVANIQGQQAIDLANITGQTNIEQIRANVAENTASLGAAVQEAQIAEAAHAVDLNAYTTITTNASNNAATTAIAGISGQTQQYVAGVIGQTQQQISTNQANVAIEQSRTNAEIAKTIAGASTTNSIIGTVGKIAGGIIGALL